MEMKDYGILTILYIDKETFQGNYCKTLIKRWHKSFISSISKMKEFHTFYFYFRAIFTAMVYDNGIKRPLVRAPNSAGVQRLITRLETIVT